MIRTARFLCLCAAIVAAVFVAAWALPPVVTHADSIAVLAGYTNQTAPLVAILLLGGLGLGVLLFRGARDEVLTIQAMPAAPWEHRTVHILAACALCVLVVVLAPVWSGEQGYFGTRLALMDAGKVPYRDFEYAYGYAVAYLPYGLHRLGLSVPAALIVSLSLAEIVGVVCLAVIVERSVSRPRLRLVLFWALVACAAFMEPGPSLNYNFGRYALPFGLLLIVTSSSDARSPPRLFGATAATAFAMYLLSPEMAFAYSAALVAWSAIMARLLGPARVAAVVLGIAAVSIALPLAAPAMFTTFEAYAGSENFMPVVANPIMAITLTAFLVSAAVNLAAALSIWSGRLAAERSHSLSLGIAWSLCAAALLPAVIGRAAPAITIAYGFVAIATAIGYLDRAGARQMAVAATSLFAGFIAYGALAGLWEDTSFVLHHKAAGPRIAAAEHQFLRARFPGAYDPLLAVHPPSPGVTEVGYYPGLEGSDVIDDAGIARKMRELARSAAYVLPARAYRAPLPEGPSPQQSLDQFRTAGLYPFVLQARPGATRRRAAFVVMLYARCRPIGGIAGIVVCRLKSR